MIQHLSATTPSSIDESAAAATASKGTGSHSAEATAQWLSGLDDSTYVDWLGPRGHWETGVIARFSDFRTELEIIQDDGGWMGGCIHCCCFAIHLLLYHDCSA
jgi:hypothetical protein